MGSLPPSYAHWKGEGREAIIKSPWHKARVIFKIPKAKETNKVVKVKTRQYTRQSRRRSSKSQTSTRKSNHQQFQQLMGVLSNSRPGRQGNTNMITLAQQAPVKALIGGSRRGKTTHNSGGQGPLKSVKIGGLMGDNNLSQQGLKDSSLNIVKSHSKLVFKKL